MIQASKLCRDCRFWEEKGNLCFVNVRDGKAYPVNAEKERNPGWLGFISEPLVCGKGGTRFSPRDVNSILGVFCIGDGSPISPRGFGLAAINTGINVTPFILKDMIGDGVTTVQCEIASKSNRARFHLVVLLTAVFYVYANALLGTSKNVLTEIYEGITDGFDELSSDQDGNPVGSGVTRLADELFRLYGESLAQELRQIDGDLPDNPFDMGATATLVVRRIAIQCEIDNLLAENAFERLRLEQIASRAGMGMLLSLWKKKHISYSA